MQADDPALPVHDPAARVLHIARCLLECNQSTFLPEKQMRVTRRRNRSESGRSNRFGALLMGALAGMVVGVLLADRGVFSGGARRRRDPDAADDTVPRPRRSPPADGVRPLKSERTPRRPADDEAELEARVLETFRNDPVLVDRPIDIGAIGTGIIELTGWVDAAEEVRHATTLTRGTIGVHTVVNRLLVKGSTSTA
jgi:BON domain